MKKINLKLTLILLLQIVTIALINAQPSNINFVLQSTAQQDIIENMQKNASAVFSEVNKADKENRNLNLSKVNITEDAIKKMKAMWETSHFYCLKPTYYQTINKVMQGYSVRNISVYFDAKNTLDNNNQDIAIYFDSNGRISNVFIAIERTQYEKLIETGIEVEEIERRIKIIHFLELFKTAYCEKDIDFIGKIFSPYALIITGNIITINNKELGPKTFVKYTEMNKMQYISQLKNVFANNKSLDIKFPEEKIKITQHLNNPNIYGVRCWQDWSTIRLDGSKGYSDKGWLTLIIDVANEDSIKVWVRAWQDTNFKEDQLIKVGNFNF